MKIGVVGSGTMGSGIGQIFAQFGHDVIMIDVVESIFQRSKDNIKSSLARLEKKGALRESPEKIMQRIIYSTNFQDLKDREMVIEAVFERVEVKKETLRKISEYVSENAIIGTNTSSISINLLSSEIRNKKRFMGIHFFNPVPVMKLVEIVKGNDTSEENMERVKQILIECEKEPVYAKDFPGFISNRILIPLLREGILAYEEGVASKEDIDKCMKLGMNHPMGPLELADFIGLDVCYDIMEVLYRDYGDPRFKPPITLRNLVNSGKLGRKSGEGFYKYEVKK
ncbi:3-hydroxyacyl-CoA dehydrogenase family protein [Caldiplasma sukawensis]